MKHRWIAIVVAVLVLAACRPADSGAEESPATSPPASTTVGEPSATPTPYAIDEY
ncbi:MAG TPA: hypothetical protein VEW95_00510 [Candidatus Limnocylindrales bacterium]|nr:hypothetical protein [Candidatus Limnocylindrales bacterium]